MQTPRPHRLPSLPPLIQIFLCTLAITTASLCGSPDVSPTTPAPHHSQRWEKYDNVRFGYSICYPSDLLAAQGESDAGDGQKFIAKDGAALLVYGSHNVLNASIQKEMRDEWASRAGKVTYKVVKPTWAVESGQTGTTIFYGKLFYADETFKVMELTYPASAAALYKPIISKLTSCFVSFKPAF